MSWVVPSAAGGNRLRESGSPGRFASPSGIFTDQVVRGQAGRLAGWLGPTGRVLTYLVLQLWPY